MSISRYARLTLVAMTAAVAAVLPHASAAQAAPTDEFNLCVNYCYSYAGGTITWYNRTASVTGLVIDSMNGPSFTTAVFEAFAGSTKIDVETRSANDESALGGERGFNFTIGDTDLVGGIDRIKITLCFNFEQLGEDCGSPENYSKS